MIPINGKQDILCSWYERIISKLSVEEMLMFPLCKCLFLFEPQLFPDLFAGVWSCWSILICLLYVPLRLFYLLFSVTCTFYFQNRNPTVMGYVWMLQFSHLLMFQSRDSIIPDWPNMNTSFHKLLARPLELKLWRSGLLEVSNCQPLS